MLALLMPDALPPQQIIMTTVARSQLPVKGKVYGTKKVCAVIENPRPSDRPGSGSLSAGITANSIFSQGRMTPPLVDLDPSKAKITLLQAPKHGTLSNTDSYTPDTSYEGNDKVVFMVEIDGYLVRVAYYLKVIKKQTDVMKFYDQRRKLCPASDDVWRTSEINTEYFTNLLTSNFPEVDPADIGFADIPGSAVAQTTGKDGKATITLDPTADGHHWYIDYTPYLNDESAPTSNPNEWIAKADSEAAGKMNLLSVLLHK